MVDPVLTCHLYGHGYIDKTKKITNNNPNRNKTATEKNAKPTELLKHTENLSDRKSVV